MRRPSAAVIVLTLLILADVVLVTGAIRSTHVSPAGTQTAHVAGDTDSSASTDNSSARQTTHRAAGRKTGKVIVAALSSTRAWRAISGSVVCTTGQKAAAIGHSEDGGATWTRVDVPMATVSGLSLKSGRMIATGLGSDCSPTSYALSSRAKPRKAVNEPDWTVDPMDPATLNAAGRPVVDQPCASGVLDIASASPSRAVVLCADGKIERTSDGGKSWKHEITVADALAIATADHGDTVYVATKASCGVSVREASRAASGGRDCLSGTHGWSLPVDATIIGDIIWVADATHTSAEPIARLAS